MSQVVEQMHESGVAAPKPGLLFFASEVSGRCRRVEGYLAQVLQRRRNHDTFRYYAVTKEQRPDLVERFRVRELPTLVVLEGKRVQARLESPRSSRQIEAFLAPWLA
jgi:thioredoxin-like negative regulator of GroEL